MASVAASSTRVFTMSREEFLARFGNPDLTGVLCGYTCEHDTLAVLTVLCHAAPARVLEIGTALGHMTANLTRWTPADARIYSIGLVGGMARAADGAPEQQGDTPPRAHWAHFANHFGTAHKAFFVMGDTMTYDFARLAPLEFVFIDGGHDLEHVLNDSRKAYDALAPGGRLVWHDFNSPVPWVRVREAVEQIGFAEEVVHVEGTEVAFLCKGGWRSLSSEVCGGGEFGVGQAGALERRFGGRQEVVSEPGDDGARRCPPPHPPFGHALPAPSPPTSCGDLSPGGEAEIRGEGRGFGVSLGPAPVRVAWEGDFEGLNSLALVNRAICRRLTDRGHDVRTMAGVDRLASEPRESTCRNGRLSLRERADFRGAKGDTQMHAQVHVRHEWPPKMEPPAHGKWVLMQPWEYGSLPKAWLPMLRRVNEVWAYSRYVRDCCHVDYIDRTLSEVEMAGLYTACDCLVHPFRGEGFALPVVEAMACGLPVIVTGAGPALDYANEETAYLIPAQRGQFAECRVGEIETIGRPWLFEPDADVLVELLKRLAGDRAEARAKGMAASAHIREHFTWANTADAVEQRLLALAEKTDGPCMGERAVLGGCVPIQADQGEGEEISRKAAKAAKKAPDNRTARHVGAEFAADQAAVGSKDSPCSSPADFSSWRSPVASLRPCVSRPKVSLTMIVRDEQENLPHCLGAVAGLFDEIVVVDTGSKDRTREIAQEFGARVFDFVWVDDFAAARNAALARATGDYAFWLDADDVIDPPRRARLEQLIGDLRPGEQAAHVVKWTEKDMHWGSNRFPVYRSDTHC